MSLSSTRIVDMGAAPGKTQTVRSIDASGRHRSHSNDVKYWDDISSKSLDHLLAYDRSKTDLLKAP